MTKILLSAPATIAGKTFPAGEYELPASRMHEDYNALSTLLAYNLAAAVADEPTPKAKAAAEPAPDNK